jgi:hypothetical protein
MKGVSFVTDETHNRRYAQMDLKGISKYSDDALEDLMDILIAEARKDEKSIPWESVKAELYFKRHSLVHFPCRRIGTLG